MHNFSIEGCFEDAKYRVAAGPANAAVAEKHGGIGGRRRGDEPEDEVADLIGGEVSQVGGSVDCLFSSRSGICLGCSFHHPLVHLFGCVCVVDGRDM